MPGLFIDVHFISGTVQDSNSSETLTSEDGDTQVLTSPQGKVIPPFVQVSQNELPRGSNERHTKTGQLVTEQEPSFASDTSEEADQNNSGVRLKVGEESKFILLENLPQDGIAQKLKVLETEASEDTQEPIQEDKVDTSHLPFICPHPLEVEKAAPVYGPEEEDVEQVGMSNFPLLTSISTDDLPDLEDDEPTVDFSTDQSSKIKILMYPDDEETY